MDLLVRSAALSPPLAHVGLIHDTIWIGIQSKDCFCSHLLNPNAHPNPNPNPPSSSDRIIRRKMLVLEGLEQVRRFRRKKVSFERVRTS